MICDPSRHAAKAARVARKAERFAERAVRARETREDRWAASSAAARRAARRQAVAADRNLNKQVLGAVLLAIGGNWLLAELGLFTLGWAGLFSIALMTLGIAMVGTAKAGRTTPLVALGVVLTLGLVLSSGISHNANAALGDVTYAPMSLSDLPTSYEGAIGDMTIDLTHLELEPGERRLTASLGVGEIRVLVPSDLPVRVSAEVTGPGEIDLLGARRAEGVRQKAGYESEDFDGATEKLDLVLHVMGVGAITVQRV